MKKAPLIYDKAMHEARKYWRDRLDSIPLEPHLALDHPRPNDGSSDFFTIEETLDPEVHALLTRISGGNSLLSYTALLLGLRIACARYAGASVVTVFSPGGDNLLPVSGPIEGSSTFKDALLATKDLLTSAYKNQHYPFSRLLLDLPDERRPKRVPLVASMTPFDGDADLAIAFDMPRVTLRFDRRIYDEATVREFFRSFTGILRQGLGKMASRIDELAPVYASEPAAAPSGVRIHALIEKQPGDRIAIVEGERTTTYKELAQANASGGTEMIVSKLASMKADVGSEDEELVSLFTFLNERCGIGSDDRCLVSPAFGASEQLYAALGMLIAGGSVEIVHDNASLAERLMDPSITVWNLPTPAMQNLLRGVSKLHAANPSLTGPRRILLSGEKQCVGLADKLRQLFPAATVAGLYSNSDSGIWTTLFPLTHSPETNGAVIAEPIPGIEHRVVNRNGELAPFRAKGELQVRRKATGLRAEPLDATRLTWLRGDDHGFVKYGCRVELTEVEAALCRHEQILAAEVISANGDANGDAVVAAFVVADREQLPPEAVRDYLVLEGGVDLIPDRIILLDEFPLTAGGAIDRDELTRRFLDSHGDAAARNAETEEIHRQLKGIWLDILQVDEVAETDSFFARGGNSLKATLLLARIQDEFGVELSVQKFFREPSTRAVAQLIAADAKDADRLKGPDFKVVSRDKYRVQLPEME